MSPKGGRMTGAAGAFALCANSSNERRLYLALRTASKKLEIVGGDDVEVLAPIADCLAFHHVGYALSNELSRNLIFTCGGISHQVNKSFSPPPPPVFFKKAIYCY